MKPATARTVAGVHINHRKLEIRSMYRYRLTQNIWGTVDLTDNIIIAAMRAFYAVAS